LSVEEVLKKRVRTQMDHRTLPRLLLRGFTFSEKSGGRRHNCVFVFAEQTPNGKSEHIDDVDAEADFFGRPGEKEAESTLSRDEDRHARLLRKLRTCRGPIEGELAEGFRAFVVHFVRGRRFRADVAGLGSEILRAFVDELDDSAVVERIVDEVMPEVLKRLPPLVVALFNRSNRERKLEIVRNARAAGAAAARKKRQAMGDLPRFDGVSEIARDNHLDVVSALGRDGRGTRFLDWSWAVCEASSGSYILADVGPVGCSRSLDSPRPIYGLASGSSELVLLPISFDRLVVGWKGGTLPSVPVEHANLAAARASTEFFVSHDDAESLRRLVGFIGSTAMTVDTSKYRDRIRQGLPR